MLLISAMSREKMRRFKLSGTDVSPDLISTITFYGKVAATSGLHDVPDTLPARKIRFGGRTWVKNEGL